MDYAAFKNKVREMPIIFSRDLCGKKGKEAQVMRNQLNRWHKKGLIIKLKRGVYLLNKADRRINPSRQYAANQLYGPSYVSLEYALGIYGLIPERVAEITSVTTRKTMTIKNGLGVFVYRHIRPVVFRGFKALKEDSGLTVFLAEPEKAVVDFLYLNLHMIPAGGTEVFRDSYRFQNTDQLKPAKITELCRPFNNLKLTRAADDFIRFVKEERRK